MLPSGCKSHLTKFRKAEQQVSSELCVQTRQREYGAREIKDTGCVIEPRNRYRCGQKDNPKIKYGMKADDLNSSEGSSPDSAMASDQDSTGV
jgi:hypothetical protein